MKLGCVYKYTKFAGCAATSGRAACSQSRTCGWFVAKFGAIVMMSPPLAVAVIGAPMSAM